jgi:hypothetical protein
MSKKVDLDDLFREITNRHEEAYNPEDWKDMQARLRAHTRLQPPDWQSITRKYLYRVTLAMVLIFLIPATQKLINEKQQLNSQKSDNQIVKNYKKPNQISNDKNSTILNSKQNTHNQTEKLANSIPNESNNSLLNTTQQLNTSQTIAKPSQYRIEWIQNPDKLEFIDNHNNLRQEKTIAKRNSEVIELLQPIEILDSKNHLANNNALQYADNQAFANKKSDIAYPIRNWQLSLTPRHSTNRHYAAQMANRKSINVLVGKSAGLNGKEFAGVGNIETDYVKGTQVAGVFNTVCNSTQGVQIAGVFNLTGEKLQGTQIAGFVNFAGLRKSKAENISQLSDNQPTKFSSQFSGLLNFDLYNPQNLQVSLVSNFAKTVNGLQAGGFLNIAEEVRGVQLSPGVNVAKKVKGVQIGLINIADSVQGVPIGLLSIVRKNGYQALEMWTSESFHYNFGYKIGVRKFYNIFALASQLDGTNSRWGMGYGFGTQINYTSSSSVNIDLIGFHVGEKLRFTRELNLLTQLRINLNKRLWNRNNVFVGPVLNTLFSDYRNADNSIGSRIAPWILWQDNVGVTKIKMWLGFNFGLSF